MNKDKGCIIQDLAQALAEDEDLKAVWVDANERKVSYAFQHGAPSEAGIARLQDITRRYQPGALPECPEGPWHVDCELCRLGRHRPLPDGVTLIPTPDHGVRLEKTTCDTARRFWRWQEFAWLKFETRVIPKPGETGLDEWKIAMAFATVCGVATATGFALEAFLPPGGLPWPLLAYLLAYLAGAWHPAEEVWGLLKKRVLDVHFLMIAVAVGAAVIGHWWEGAVLLFLFSFSGALEELAMARTEREIKGLFKDAPKEATVVGDDGVESRLPVDDLRPGAILRVRPGEQFAVDSQILSGTTAADEANLTGESIPVEKQLGDRVFSGTLNLWGSVDCRVLLPASESTLAKIITLIHSAQESKAPSQRLTDKFGTRYTWGVLGLSVAMFLYWWLIDRFPPFTAGPGEKSAFYRAMTLMVVASPCALVLSIPSAILAGIAAGARRGILFRGGAAIEQLAEITRVAMDKTGTLTTGELEVIKSESFPAGPSQRLLEIAAALSHHSTHPVSRAIRHQAPAGTDRIEGFRSLTGMGVEGTLRAADGSTAHAVMGRRTLFPWAQSIPIPDIGVTETFVECGPVRGRILLRDRIRDESAPLIRQMQQRGLLMTMLTGDREEAAHHVATALGLDDFRAHLTPEEKVAAIQTWTAAGERVAMIGDGVNDAPCLAAAHVAVGMGLRGSDAVLEQADVVLMQDRLENFAFAHALSRRARRIIRQNLAISLGVIGVLVLSALGSFIPLTLGVVGHEGSTVIVVLNSLRLLWNPQPHK